MSTNTLPIGTHLRSELMDYTIEQVLGQGGFGITYRASTTVRLGQINTRVHVAIKEHFPAADCWRQPQTHTVSFSIPSADRVASSRRDFISEANRLRSISGLHPNIVSVNEVFEANGTAYYVMEYIDGLSLKAYVERHGPLSLQQTMAIIRPLIQTLAHLHRQRITHLDIKPANIMLAGGTPGQPSLRPVLIDFGLSKHYSADGSATSTIGTGGFSEGYAPIEQYAGLTCFSPAVDVYSLAATILYCLTGKTPPQAHDLTADYITGALTTANTPPTLSQVIHKALAMNRRERIHNAQILAEMMAAAYPDHPGNTVSLPGLTAAAANGASDNDATQIGILPPPDTDATHISATPPSIHPPVPPITSEAEKSADDELDQALNEYENNCLFDSSQSSKSSPLVWVVIVLLAIVAGVATSMILINGGIFGSTAHVRHDVADTTVIDNQHPDPTGSDHPDTPKEQTPRLAKGQLTGDLAFHFLSGPVKSIVNEWGQRLTFDRDGNWTNSYSDHLGPRTLTRDSQHRIVREAYNSASAGSGAMDYQWQGMQVSSMDDYNRGQHVYYTYGPNGFPSLQITKFDPSEKHPYGKENRYDYADYRFDSKGNWISRTQNGKCQSRTITYYD